MISVYMLPNNELHECPLKTFSLSMWQGQQQPSYQIHSATLVR